MNVASSIGSGSATVSSKALLEAVALGEAWGGLQNGSEDLFVAGDLRGDSAEAGDVLFVP